MTELLEGLIEVAGEAPALSAVRLPQGWRVVSRVANSWIVETDWWRAPVRRHYLRLLLADGECVEVYRDLDTGDWRLVRRYD